MSATRIAYRESRGFALVIVLWTTVLLAVVAGSFGFSMRTESAVTRNLMERAEAGVLAEAGIELGILKLLAQSQQRRPAEGQWRVDGHVYEVQFGDDTIRIALTSELGKIDLNLAPAEVIEGLGEVLGGDSSAIGDRILDWRDPDSVRLPGGAEDADYRAAGRAHGAGDGWFVSVAEVGQLLEVRPETARRIANLTTVYARQRKVDPMNASRDALLALPGLDAGIVDRFLEERETSISRGSDPPLHLLREAAAYLFMSGTSPYRSGFVYTVEAEGVLAGGTKAKRTVVVRISRGRKQPYTVLSWSHDVYGDAEEEL